MAFVFGSVTSSGDVQQLAATGVRVKQVIIQATPTNSGPILIGDYAAVTASTPVGLQVDTPATGPVVGLPIVLKSGVPGDFDLSGIYAVSPGGTQGVNFLYEIY